MKRRLLTGIPTLILIVLCTMLSAQAEIPRLSPELKSAARKAMAYLESCEYERIVQLLPFSDVAPGASEWQSFAEGSFSSLFGASGPGSPICWYNGKDWRIAVPATGSDSSGTECLVLISRDGSTVSGYRHSTLGSARSDAASAEAVEH